MGTTLTGTTPQDTYDSLIKVTDNGPLSGTAKYLSDGLGNDSVLALSTSAVGIGRSPSAGYIFDVETSLGSYPRITGSDQANVRLRFSNGGSGGRSYEIIGGLAGANNSNFSIFDATASATRLTIDSTGNVGMGTSTPSGKLHVSSTGDTYFVLTGGSTPLSYSFLVDANDMRLFTGVGDSEKLRVTSSYLRLASGMGGIQFNGDTAAANALDDYEEGTFTPTTAGDATGAFSSVLGEYTKIGNVVHFRIAAAVSANFTDNFIGGLPFTVGGSGSPSGIVSVIGIANDNFGDLSALITVGTTSVRTYSDNNLSNQYPPLTTMGTLRMFGTYRV